MGRKKMITFSKIMVGCDFSEYSRETLEYAASLAEKCQAELIIVNIINQRDVDTILAISDKQFDRAVEKSLGKLADDYVKREMEKRTRQMEKLVEAIFGTHLPIKKIVRVGVPFQELMRAIEGEKADLMIVGPKGHGNLAGVLFGSNAEKLFRHCPVPLLSVRSKKE
jgi:nucleotide-binding universal stress UspA family protein